MKHYLMILSVVVILVVLAFQPAQADDRDLLKASGAPPHVLLILDSGASMSLNGMTNSVNYLAGGDDEGGRYTQEMLAWYAQTYDGSAPGGIPGPEALELYPDELRADHGYSRDEADQWGLGLGPNPLGYVDADGDWVQGQLGSAIRGCGRET